MGQNQLFEILDMMFFEFCAAFEAALCVGILAWRLCAVHKSCCSYDPGTNFLTTSRSHSTLPTYVLMSLPSDHAFDYTVYT
jgi:hypothetical protein